VGKSQRSHHLIRIGKEAAFPVFIGLFLGFLIGAGTLTETIFGALFSAYFLYRRWQRGRREGIAFLSSLLLGLTVRLLSDRLPYPGEVSSIGIVREARDSYFILDVQGRRYAIFLKDSPYEAGDILKVRGNVGKVLSAHYEGRFDFGAYLEGKGVWREIEDPSIEAVFLSPLRLRSGERAFLSSFEEPLKGLLDSFLFGVTDYANESLLAARRLGLLSVFGVSGVYLSLIKRLAAKLFSLLPKQKRYQPLFVFLTLFPFGLFGLRKAGVRRILGVSFWEAAFALAGKEKPGYLVLTPSLALLEFVFDPYSVVSEGFLLSYGLSFLFFALGTRLKKGGRMRKFLLPRLIAVLYFLPAYVTNASLSLVAPFGSYLLSPLLLPFLFLGRLAFLFPVLKLPLTGYGGFLTDLLARLSDLPLTVPVYGSLAFEPRLHYALLYLAVLFYQKGLFYLSGRLAMLRLLSIVISYLPRPSGLMYEVSFIDVGQGDAILLRVGSHALLVDTGGVSSFDIAEETLIPYFRKKGLRRLEALVVTHEDNDHMGGRASLLSSFPVDSVLDASSFPYDFQGAKIECLNGLEPLKNDKNRASLVLSFAFNGTSFLLMGDATEETERELLREGKIGHADILKVGHHGSDSSSSLSFLKAVSPQEAVISCGEGNRYGHPAEEVTGRLSSLGIAIRRTDLEGTVTYRGFL